MFDKAFDRVIGSEGGFQKDRLDRGNWTGGAVNKGKLRGTKFGLSAMAYPDIDIEGLTVNQAKAIYFEDWWERLKLERFPQRLQFQMFDAAINHGQIRANKILQKALGVNADGIIGMKTMTAMNKAEPEDLLLEFIACRLDFYTQIDTFKRYGKGWIRRMAKNLRYAAEDN